MEAAIKHRVQVDHPLGSELSGGLDSSTVIAYAIKHFQRPLNDFHTFAFARFSDEPKYILGMSQYFRIPMSYICCNITLFHANPTRALHVLGGPVQHGNAASHEIFYDMAESRGVKTLLSGFGGDEFVTCVHDHLYLHELHKNKQYFKLHQNLNGNLVMRSLRFLRFLYNHFDSSGIKNRNTAIASAQRWPFHIVADKLVESYTLKAHYDTEGSYDYGYWNLDQFILERMLAPYTSTRTEECTLLAGTYGINYQWPLLDVRLIQCYLSIPSSEKYYRGVQRHLHKQAIVGIVPKEIIAKKSKHMGERIAHSIPKQHTLNDDIHPALFALCNMAKLREQEKHLIGLVTVDPSHLLHQKQRPIVKNILRINQLDRWLKYYFPNGTDWANIP